MQKHLVPVKIIEKGHPKKIIIIGAILAEDRKKRILKYNPEIKFYVAATDPILNEVGYIIPGLGDAGDRSYGYKKALPSLLKSKGWLPQKSKAGSQSILDKF